LNSLFISARYILSNRKNKQKSTTQCRSKIKKYRESDVEFKYNSLNDFDPSGHKLKRLKVENKRNFKYCSVTIKKTDINKINLV